MVPLKVLGLELGFQDLWWSYRGMTSKAKAFRQLMIVDNPEIIKFNFQKSSAGTIQIVKDREKLEENSCISLKKMTYEYCHD